MKNYILWIVILTLIQSCKSNKPILSSKMIQGKSYISVQSYGAMGDGKTNDLGSIQKAINKEEFLYFPKGKYRLNGSRKGVHFAHFLLINNKSKARNLYFEKGAILYIKEDCALDIHHNAILSISTLSGDIRNLSISGINIYREPFKTSKKYVGIWADEYEDKFITNLSLENISIENMSDQAIINHAKHAILRNIKTVNSGMHGVICKNPFNQGVEHYVTIDGFTSINDKGYSLDFSGHIINKQGAVARGDTWTGNVTNVQSINSGYGIKTAGHWNLKMENVLVQGSSMFGFFINIDSPQRTIKVKNMSLENCMRGLNLFANSNFEAYNLSIIECGESINIQDAKVKIDSLYIDGKGKDKLGIYIANNTTINNFEVTGLSSNYPIQIAKDSATLTNGKIFGNDNKEYAIWVQSHVNDMHLENIEISTTKKNKTSSKGVLIDQKKGTLKVHNITKDNLQLKMNNRSKIKVQTRKEEK